MLTPIAGDRGSYTLTLSDGLTIPLCGGLSAKRLEACERETVALRAAWRAYASSEDEHGRDSAKALAAIEAVRAAAVVWADAMRPHVTADPYSFGGEGGTLEDLRDIVGQQLPSTWESFYIVASKAILASRGIATDDHGLPMVDA